MKKTILLGVGYIMLLNLTGCVSYYNHHRIQNSGIKRQAIIAQDTETLKYISAGISPKRAVRIRVLQSNSGDVDGLAFAFEPYGLRGYFESFKEAKISSTFALLADAAIGYGLLKAGEEGYDSILRNESKTTTEINISGDATYVTSEGSSISTIDNSITQPAK